VRASLTKLETHSAEREAKAFQKIVLREMRRAGYMTRRICFARIDGRKIRIRARNRGDGSLWRTTPMIAEH
jgi:hypothetical protein